MRRRIAAGATALEKIWTDSRATVPIDSSNDTNNMPKEAISKERQEIVRDRLEEIVDALQPLSAEERVRVLRTTVVFFSLEREMRFE